MTFKQNQRLTDLVAFIETYADLEKPLRVLP